MNKQEATPSVYTIIDWLILDDKIEPEMLFRFSEFYWPTFIQKDNYFFLKEKFSEERYVMLLNNSQNLEYWINLVTIDDFFSKVDHGEEKSIALAKMLAEIWQIKLRKEFPNTIFIVEHLEDKECGDYGLTFYQKK